MASAGTGAALRWGREEAHRTGMSVAAVWVTALAPALMVALCMLLVAVPVTREVTLRELGENRPVEMLTFVALLAAGVLAGRQAWRSWRTGDGPRWTAFYVLFAVGAVVVAMEEVAWGQWLVGFSTPPALERVNVQGELTLHNIGPLQGRSEWFRIVAGVLGLAGVALHRSERLRRFAVPRVLVPLFAVVLLKSLSDVAVDLMTLPDRVVFANRRLSELIELLIGAGTLLYIWLTTRQRRVP